MGKAAYPPFAYNRLNLVDNAALTETDRADRSEQPGAQGRMTGAAAALSYFAAAPLIIAALVVVSAPAAGEGAAQEGAAMFMALYGVLMIVFFGGVRWGVAVMKPEGPTLRSLTGAALPFLAALPLFIPFDLHAKFMIIMGLMTVLLIDDLNATRRGSGAPEWYLGVRLPLTALILVGYLVALAGM